MVLKLQPKAYNIVIPNFLIYFLQGEVAVNRRVDTRSYSSLHALVNGMFPPMNLSTAEQV